MLTLSAQKTLEHQKWKGLYYLPSQTLGILQIVPYHL